MLHIGFAIVVSAGVLSAAYASYPGAGAVGYAIAGVGLFAWVAYAVKKSHEGKS